MYSYYYYSVGNNRYLFCSEVCVTIAVEHVLQSDQGEGGVRVGAGGSGSLRDADVGRVGRCE